MFTEIAHIVPRTSGWRPRIYPASIIVDSGSGGGVGVGARAARDRRRERDFPFKSGPHENILWSMSNRGPDDDFGPRTSSVKTPGPGQYIFCDSVLPSDGVAVVVCTQLRTTSGDNSLTCRRSNDLEPVSCRLRRPRRPACRSLQVTGLGPSAPSAL
eukprot:scaffold53433_cov63-Phaeocystis_antarctica.AAC.1